MIPTFRGHRGFTLIELLVVIAIIAILSSVVIAGLNRGRLTAADAAVKSNLVNIRPQSEMVYDALGCYGDNIAGTSADCATGAITAAACNAQANTLFAEPTIVNMINEAKSASNGASGLAACASTAGQAAWAIAVPLKTDTTKAWCVDSTGVSKQVANASAYTQTSLNGDVSGGVCGS